MAFKDTGRWQEQLCDTSNHRIFGDSSSGLKINYDKGKNKAS